MQTPSRSSNLLACPPLREAAPFLQFGYSFPAARGRYQFFERRSCKACLFSISSAKSFFSFAFSSSNAFSLLASDTFMPPYFAFQL